MAGKGTAFQERFKKKKKVSCSAWSISASYCFIFSFALLREQRKKKPLCCTECILPFKKLLGMASFSSKSSEDQLQTKGIQAGVASSLKSKPKGSFPVQDDIWQKRTMKAKLPSYPPFTSAAGS